MPRNSLQNLDALDQGSAPANAAEVPGRPTDLTQPADRPGGAQPHLDDMAQLPEELRALLGRRRVLEQRMSSLIGGSPQQSDAVNARRFPVTPLGERRRQDADWARLRERSSADSDRPLVDRGRRLTEAAQQIGGAVRRSGESFREPPHRSGQRPLRQPGRELSEAVRPLGDLSLDRFRNDPAVRDLWRDSGRGPAEPMVRPLRSLDDTLADARRRLDILQGGSGDLDRLRETAMTRLRQRRDEAAELDRQQRARQTQPDPEQRRDEQRDRARLDGQTGRSDDD